MSRQTKTITRLVEIKRRNAELAEAKYAAARSDVMSAERASMLLENAWRAAIDANEAIGSTADLERRDLHIRALRRAVDEGERTCCLKRARERETHAAMIEASIELRRFETWLEREAREQSLEARRIERIAEDEVASRKRSAG